MQFKIAKQNFLNLVQNIQGVVERSPLKVSLLNIHLGTRDGFLHGLASDGKLHARDKCPIEEIIPGSIMVSAKKLYDILKLLPDGEVSFKVEENFWIDLECQSSLYHVPGYNAMDFETFPIYPDKPEGDFSIPADIFTDMVGKTSFAVSDEMERAVSGLRIEFLKDEFRMVATDGHRLALVKTPFPGPQEPVYHLIPRKTVRELKRMFSDRKGDLLFALDKDCYYFKLDDLQLISNKMEGFYPNYERVIPKNAEKKVLIDRNILIQTIQRVALMSDETSLGIFLDITKNFIRAFAETPEIGNAKDEIEIEYQGEDFKVSYNPFYLLEMLRIIKDDRISLELNDIFGPCMIRGENSDDYLFILMPMKPR